jgi:DNA modification methylase
MLMRKRLPLAKAPGPAAKVDSVSEERFKEGEQTMLRRSPRLRKELRESVSTVPRPAAPDLVGRVEYLSPDQLKEGARQIRKRSPRFQKKLMESVRTFGLLQAIVVDRQNVVVSGHGLLAAARQLGLKNIPVIRAEHLTATQLRGFALAHNKLGEMGEWNLDDDGLPAELRGLLAVELDFNFEATGFEWAEADQIIFSKSGKKDERGQRNFANDGPVVSRLGSRWALDKHLAICGDARSSDVYDQLLEGRKAQVVITDMPYGVKIEGHASGKGKTRHRPFLMGGDEMTDEQLHAFYVQSFEKIVRYSDPGAIVYSAIDWRNFALMQAAAREASLELVNLVVWVKDNPGMGSFYRSGHELFLVLRNGSTQHQNNVQLGRFGRNRVNVWNYAGANDFGRGGGEGDLLAKHPTPKPVPLLAGALLDSTRRGDLVLDPFVGSGSTIIAAEQTGRIAAGIELDPIYVDVTVERWQTFTGGTAIEVSSGLSFEELRRQRTEQDDAA